MRGLGRLFGLGVVVAACAGESPGMGETTETDSAAEPSTSDGSTHGDAMSDPTGGTSSEAGTSDGSTTGESGGPFPGCGRDPGLEGVTVGSMEVAGMQRSFVLRLPDNYDPAEPLALLFGFHGRGGTAELFRNYSGLEQAAPHAAVFVYPQGLPIASMGGQSGWDLDPNGHDVAFVSQLLGELAMNLCIDPARVYATGHSFGGYFSNTLGCGLADRLRAIGPVAGGGPFGTCPQPMAAIVIHGLDDEVVPTSAGEASRDHWLSNNGCGADTEPAEPGPCVAHQGCDPDHGVVWCLHEESPPGIGTHTWPSFAAERIWSFFVAHGA